MHSKKAAFACSLSLAAVAILVPLVPRVNHFGTISQTNSGVRELRADGNPIPPLPPRKDVIGAPEPLTADGNPIPPLPPPKGGLQRAQILSADGNPIPPLPPRNQFLAGSDVYIADGNPIPPLPPPKGLGKTDSTIV